MKNKLISKALCIGVAAGLMLTGCAKGSGTGTVVNTPSSDQNQVVTSDNGQNSAGNNQSTQDGNQNAGITPDALKNKHLVDLSPEELEALNMAYGSWIAESFTFLDMYTWLTLEYGCDNYELAGEISEFMQRTLCPLEDESLKKFASYRDGFAKASLESWMREGYTYGAIMNEICLARYPEFTREQWVDRLAELGVTKDSFASNGGQENPTKDQGNKPSTEHDSFVRGSNSTLGYTCTIEYESTIFSWLYDMKTEDGTVSIDATPNRWSEDDEIDESTIQIQIKTGQTTYTISGGVYYPEYTDRTEYSGAERFAFYADTAFRFEYSKITDANGKTYDTEGVLAVYFDSGLATDVSNDPINVIAWKDTALGVDRFLKDENDNILVTPYGYTIEFHAGEFECKDCSVYINHNYVTDEKYDLWIQSVNNENGFVTGGVGASWAVITPGAQVGSRIVLDFVDDEGISGTFVLDYENYTATLTHPYYNGGQAIKLSIKKLR